jgi:hypothetical protein
MRAVIWLFGCLGLLWAAQWLHLWRPMLDTMVILAIWVWIFGGAAWVGAGAPARRRAWTRSAADEAALKAAAERLAQRESQSQGGPTP